MMHGYRTGSMVASALLGTAFLAFAACSSDPEPTCGIGDDCGNLVGSGGDPGAGGGPATGGGFLGGTGGSITAGAGGGGPVKLPPEAICDESAYASEPSPVDMYIMLDRSVSMTEMLAGSATTKWQGVVGALNSFLSDPATGSLRAGIQFFPQPDPNRCEINAYATPIVDIQQLPAAGGVIMGAVNGTAPQGFTPLGTALQGAVTKMQTWAAANPDRVHAVVLVTDGFPTECEPRSIHEIRAIAEAAFAATPQVRTFVVGIGEGVANADTLAEGGGTGVGFHIESGDVQQQFLAAMLSIASAPMACEYEIPEAPQDPMFRFADAAEVAFQPAVGAEEELLTKVRFYGECSQHPDTGWYFDDVTNPTKVIICPAACRKFAAGVLKIRLTCEEIPDDTM